MMYNLENEFLMLKINSFGAELSSILDKNDGYEYIWQGDTKYWGKHAPILFPIVGNLQNKRYRFEGKEYEMNQHGFAKNMEFSEIEYSKNKLTLCLNYNDATIIQYPFKFQLLISYTLKGRTLTEEYKVKNVDQKDLWFSIGGHPGFCCSVSSEGYKDVHLMFPMRETVCYLENESGYLTGNKKIFMNNQNFVDISKIDFDGKKKVYTLQGLKSKNLVIEDALKAKKVRIDFDGFPYIGIWSPSNSAPFICIEPWYGITSTRNVDKDFNHKQGIVKLETQKCFSCSFNILCE